MEWSIHEIARLAGTTSRTLRHYGQTGLLAPSRLGANGYRYYDQHALVRLQRILLLRQLGLGLSAIGRVLDGQHDTDAALRTHLRLLERERDRLARQIASVRTTLRKLEEGEELMAEEVLGGFDHRQYEQEVTERWGREAWQSGDRWWRALTEEQKKEFQQRHTDIAADYGTARAAGRTPGSDEVQAIAARHVDWLSATSTPTRDYLLGLSAMWVDDPRFAANYDRYGEGAAVFVRDAVVAYVQRTMPE